MTAILLIDNDADTVDLITLLMEGRNHAVQHAPTALEGLRMARTDKPDIVLVAMNLPDLNGKVVVHQLRSYPGFKNTPIVAIAYESNSHERRLALAFGCNEFISKPINAETFPEQIEALAEYSKQDSPQP